MTASLIIPTYNRGEVLCDTIAMALEQNYPDFEVIVVDQTTSVAAKVQSYVESLGDRIQYHRLSPPNLPAARNVGVRAASGNIVIFIDDDVRIQPDYISSHVQNFRDSSVGAVMGLTLDATNASVEEYLKNVRPVFGISGTTGNEVEEAKWVLGGNTSYRRSAILEAGMSDERFGGSGWYEDADLAVRVRHLGYRLLLDSRISLVHLALPSGGCRNRDANWLAKREQEHLQLFAFFNIKNCKILGPREVCKSLVRAYRRFSLNRTLIRRGFRELSRRHLTYIGCLVQAFRWSLFSKMARPVNSAGELEHQ